MVVVPEFLNSFLLIPGLSGSVKLILVLLFPLGHAAGAEGLADSLRRGQDTAYIQSYSDKLIVKLDLDNDVIRFKLTGDGFRYDIRPNLGPNRILSLNYRWAYVGVSYLPEFVTGNKWDERRGETSGFGLGGGITSPRFLFDIQYGQVRGFYLHNTADYVPGWDPDSDPYIQFPELKLWMIRGAAYYKANPNFSLRAIQSQTEAQRKSAASLLPGLAYNYYVIDNYSTAGPSSQRSDNLLLIAQLNYYATRVLHRRWYATLGAGGGAGINHIWLLTRQPAGDVESTQTNGVVRGFLNAGLGYNGTRFIAGAEVLHHQSFTRQQDVVDMVLTRTAYQVFVGYRFTAPVFLKKSFDKVGL
jgi:hypothetical protein